MPSPCPPVVRPRNFFVVFSRTPSFTFTPTGVFLSNLPDLDANSNHHFLSQHPVSALLYGLLGLPLMSDKLNFPLWEPKCRPSRPPSAHLSLQLAQSVPSKFRIILPSDASNIYVFGPRLFVRNQIAFFLRSLFTISSYASRFALAQDSPT